jgi:hypothetical protein
MAQAVAAVMDMAAARLERDARVRLEAVAAGLDQAGLPGAAGVRCVDARAMLAAGWSPMEIAALALRDALGMGVVEDGGRIIFA